MQNITFTKDWWNKVILKTNNLQETNVIKKALNNEDISNYKDYVKQIIYSINQLKTTQYGYRVYVEGKKLDPSEMENEIFPNSPQDDETLEDWGKRIFKGKNYGIIINSGEKFNELLSSDVATKLSPLMQTAGFPVDGINFSIFIGNYDKTPLGIHQDPMGENVLHFHLGSSSKEMLTWDEDLYVSKFKNSNHDKHDYKSIINDATKHLIEEGDLYFMPHGEYHIGVQNGFSIAITVWFYNHSNNRLLYNYLDKVFNEIKLSNKENSIIYPLTSQGDYSTKFEEITQKSKKSLYNSTLSEVLFDIFLDKQYCLQSNAGYFQTPFDNKEKIDFNIDDKVFFKKPYKVLYRYDENNKKIIYIYLRGVKYKLNKINGIEELIEMLNENDVIDVKTLFQIFENNNYKFEVLETLLNLFYSNNLLTKK